MKQKLNPPRTGLVLEIGSGDNPNARSDILCDRFISDDTERGGNIVIDRPLVVADAIAVELLFQKISTLSPHVKP